MQVRQEAVLTYDMYRIYWSAYSKTNNESGFDCLPTCRDLPTGVVVVINSVEVATPLKKSFLHFHILQISGKNHISYSPIEEEKHTYPSERRFVLSEKLLSTTFTSHLSSSKSGKRNKIQTYS